MSEGVQRISVSNGSALFVATSGSPLNQLLSLHTESTPRASWPSRPREPRAPIRSPRHDSRAGSYFRLVLRGVVRLFASAAFFVKGFFWLVPARAVGFLAAVERLPGFFLACPMRRLFLAGGVRSS